MVIDDQGCIKDARPPPRQPRDATIGRCSLCRSESDWLIGINATRASLANSRKGGSSPPADGLGPTSLIVKRERPGWALSRTYFNLISTSPENGSYTGKWIILNLSRMRKTTRQTHRIWREQADALLICTGKPAQVKETSKKVSERSPQL